MTADLPAWAECLFAPSRYKAVWGGRGGSKSRSIATALVLRAGQAPERILCAREVQKSIKDSVKRLLDDEIDRLGLRALFASTDAEIRGRNGSLFIFAGLRGNASQVKSLEGVTIAWVEEAQSISQASLDTLIPTIREAGSELWFSWNPLTKSDPVDALFRADDPPSDAIVREVQYEDNPWFPDDLRRLMEWHKARDYDKYLHIWRGAYWGNAPARVFGNWTINADLEAPPGVEFRLGADFGFSIDPSCAVRCWIDGRRLCVDYEAWGLGVEIVNLSNLFMTIPDAEKWWMTADTSRPETISHLRNNGFPRIRPAIKGARSVEEGVEFLKSFDIEVHPRCVHMIEELGTYSYKTDRLTGDVLPVLEDKDNHCIAEGERVLCRRGIVPIGDVATTDEVWTRAGWKRVLFAGQTDADRAIVEIITAENKLRCTPDHEVWVVDKGMVRADALRYGDELLLEVMAHAGPTTGARDNPSISTRLGTSLKNGTHRRRGEQSMSRSGRWPMLRSFLSPSPAAIVGSVLSRAKLAMRTCFARTGASPHTVALAGLITSSGSARNAGPGIPSTDTAKPRLVPARVETVRALGRCARVYDLTVEDQHEFVCEGILVSNCVDALRYALEGARRAKATKPTFVPVIPGKARR